MKIEKELKNRFKTNLINLPWNSKIFIITRKSLKKWKYTYIVAIHKSFLEIVDLFHKLFLAIVDSIRKLFLAIVDLNSKEETVCISTASTN